jgi:hypothetical protein
MEFSTNPLKQSCNNVVAARVRRGKRSRNSVPNLRKNQVFIIANGFEKLLLGQKVSKDDGKTFG